MKGARNIKSYKYEQLVLPSFKALLFLIRFFLDLRKVFRLLSLCPCSSCQDTPDRTKLVLLGQPPVSNQGVEVR